MRIIVIFTLLISKSLCQNKSSCDSDAFYSQYHEIIANSKDNLNNLLETFQDLKALNNSLFDLNNKLQDFPKNSWKNDIEAANETVNKRIPYFNETIEQFNVGDWIKLLNELKEVENNLLNLPFSTSNEITFVEYLLANKNDDSCLAEFHKQINQLFIQIATMLDFERTHKDLLDISRDAEINRQKAEKILLNTKTILETEANLKKTLELSNKSAELANEVKSLKNRIERKQRDIKNLYNNFEEEINQLGEGTKENIENIEDDINGYLENIDCYIEILMCDGNRYLSDKCTNKIGNCTNI